MRGEINKKQKGIRVGRHQSGVSFHLGMQDRLEIHRGRKSRLMWGRNVGRKAEEGKEGRYIPVPTRTWDMI